MFAENALQMDKLFKLSLLIATIVAISTVVKGNEIKLTCIEGFVEAPEACVTVENTTVTVNDSVLITNVDKFRNTTEFGVKDANWDVIPSSIFSTFPNLRRIEMAVNIKQLTAETFSNAKNLRSMDLSSNQIEVIPRNTFTGAPNLAVIYFSKNNIRNIEDGAFNGLTHLSYLRFTRNDVRIIRNGTFAGALDLIRIQLDRNQIETIEADAFNLPQLQSIDLGHNKLKTSNADIFNAAPLLRSLTLNDNELRQVNEMIGKLRLNNLQTLVLANNPLESINLGLAMKLPKLDDWNLSNTTSMVYTEIMTSRKLDGHRLEFIDLSCNNLTRSDILSGLKYFPNLHHLNLELNLFSKIDGLNRIHESFKELHWLFIGCNRFECQWLSNELQTLNVTLDVVSCPEPTITGAMNVKNVNCV